MPWYVAADHGSATFKFLHCFSANSKSEYNAVKSVACKSVMGSMVPYDFDCAPDVFIELI